MSDETGLVPAFVAALAELTVIEKAHEAKAGAFSYQYADLGDLVKLTRPVLAKHGLAAVTPVHGHGDGLAVTVTLYHSSGESLAFEPLTFPHGKDAQTTGSWITYMRRYALLAALGMAAGDDDDGARAVEGSTQARRTPGLRTSVLDAIAKLEEPDRSVLRSWCEANEIPIVPAQMTEEQCGRVIDWIMEHV